jgi:hypothetical protein
MCIERYETVPVVQRSDSLILFKYLNVHSHSGRHLNRKLPLYKLRVCLVIRVAYS